ncbi:uncharacterized protein LOC113289165 isoform X1 [Papaver somniferum]|uniref:uncharacterized protein LOC113289165 isoform X1 n=1 Tax=Papaver somniferum TaxID=3469 RepID=UPI000E703D9F|nr:uncharacterized protein LOC113289165 isoform X1 [Papaver somniferum]
MIICLYFPLSLFFSVFLRRESIAISGKCTRKQQIFSFCHFLMHCIHFPRRSGDPTFEGTQLIFWIVMLRVYISWSLKKWRRTMNRGRAKTDSRNAEIKVDSVLTTVFIYLYKSDRIILIWQTQFSKTRTCFQNPNWLTINIPSKLKLPLMATSLILALFRQSNLKTEPRDDMRNHFRSAEEIFGNE